MWCEYTEWYHNLWSLVEFAMAERLWISFAWSTKLKHRFQLQCFRRGNHCTYHSHQINPGLDRIYGQAERILFLGFNVPLWIMYWLATMHIQNVCWGFMVILSTLLIFHPAIQSFLNQELSSKAEGMMSWSILKTLKLGGRYAHLVLLLVIEWMQQWLPGVSVISAVLTYGTAEREHQWIPCIEAWVRRATVDYNSGVQLSARNWLIGCPSTEVKRESVGKHCVVVQNRTCAALCQAGSDDHYLLCCHHDPRMYCL